MNDTPIEIRPSRGIARVGLRELWTYRDLVYFFVWRDVKVRYKQTLFGGAWAIIQPLVLMVVFTFVFGRVLKVADPPGRTEADLLLRGPGSLDPLRDVPGRLLRRVSLRAPALVQEDLLPSTDPADLCRGIELGGFRRGVERRVRDDLRVRLGDLVEDRLRSPCSPCSHVLTALSFGLWVSALNARYRDVRYAIPFLVQVLLFLTPVFFSASSAAPGNPGSLLPESDGGCRRGFPVGSDRYAILRPGPLTLLSAAIMLVLLVGGLFYFRTAERTFADVI